MNFSSAAKAQMSGATVRCDILAEFQFVSGTVRVWNGFGALTTLDAKVWQGVAGLADISGISPSLNGSAPPISMTLSGVDSTFAAKAKAEASEYYYRPVVFYLQFFGDGWECLDNPYGLTMARMTQLTARRESTEEGMVHTVTLTAESPFAVRRRPKFGYLTDRDQQARFAGDRGLERVAGIDNKPITFPAF